MARYALVDSAGLVVNVIDIEDLSKFPDPEGLSLIESDQAATGDTWNGSVFHRTETPSPPVNLVTYAENKRWKKEVGGIYLNGIPIATDDRSKQMILGARVAADGDPDFTTPWVGADGAVYPLDAAAVIAVSNAVLSHVAACFAIYATVKADIDGGTIATTAQIDAAFA